jgi:hypothetical protein
MEEQLRCLGYLEYGDLAIPVISFWVSALVGGTDTAASYPSATLANEMDAAVWTAIGLLAATSLGTLFYLGSRIDALASRMDARFDRVDARFDHMEERFDALASRLDAHLDRHAT